MRRMVRMGFLCSMWLAAGSCGGSGNGIASGAWDGTFTNLNDFKGAEFSVTDSTLDLAVIFQPEGQAVSAGCTVKKYRYEFSFVMSGDKGTGSWYYSYEVIGSGCAQTHDVHDLFGTLGLKRLEGTGSAPNNLEGTWELTDGKGFIAQMTLLGSKMTGNYGIGSKVVRFDGSLTDRSLQATTTDRIEFAAMRH